MAGKPIQKTIAQAMEKVSEEELFRTHLEEGSVVRALAKLKPQIGQVSKGSFFDWIKADKERHARWKAHLAIVAFNLVDESLEIVEQVADNPRAVPGARLRVEQRRWMAERFNRSAFGARPDTTVVGINLADDYMTALKRVEERHKQETAIEPEYTVVDAEFEENVPTEEITNSSEAAEGPHEG